MFCLGCCSLLSVEIILHCSRMSKSLFILSCKCIGTLLGRCFLKNALDLRARGRAECFFFNVKI